MTPFDVRQFNIINDVELELTDKIDAIIDNIINEIQDKPYPAKEGRTLITSAFDELIRCRWITIHLRKYLEPRYQDDFRVRWGKRFGKEI